MLVALLIDGAESGYSKLNLTVLPALSFSPSLEAVIVNVYSPEEAGVNLTCPPSPSRAYPFVSVLPEASVITTLTLSAPCALTITTTPEPISPFNLSPRFLNSFISTPSTLVAIYLTPLTSLISPAVSPSALLASSALSFSLSLISDLISSFIAAIFLTSCTGSALATLAASSIVFSSSA